MRLKALTLLLALLAALPSHARGFDYTYEGQTLTYTVIDETARIVNVSGNNVSGDLIIPAIAYDGDAEKIGYTVASIRGYGFYECYDLTSVNIPNSVTSIGNGAFEVCRGLTSVTIGNSVTEICKSAFYDCRSLKSVNIPNSVTSIGDSAFRNCSGITEVTIGNSVTSIDKSAFSGCTSLTSVTIPNSVTSIEESAFSDCSDLTSVTISSSVKTISTQAFRNCCALSSVDIPNSVTEIGMEAFENCSGLTSVTIGNSVKTIGSWAFRGCGDLKKAAYPNRLENPFPGEVVFRYVYDPVDALASDGFVLDKDKKEVRFAPYASDGKYYVPKNIISIGENAYSYSSNMTSIEIPDNVTSIGSGSFSNCEMLKEVILPLRLESIGEAVFENSNSIKNVVFRGPTPVEGSADVFDSEVYENATLYVRSGRTVLFQRVSPWKFFFDITDANYSKTLITSLSFKKNSYNISPGATLNLNKEVQILPGDATDKELTWRSSDETVATISQGVVTALAEGKCFITATTTDGSNLTAKCEVTVIKQSGIEAISAEAEDDAEYFTLQGIRVKADKLAPGVYIRRIGNRTDKVLVK